MRHVKTTESDHPASDLISVLRNRAPRVAMTLAAGQMAWPAAAKARSMIRERTTYTVKVSGADPVYDSLHEWVLGLLHPDEQRALVAWSPKQARHSITDAEDSRPSRAAVALRLRYDGTREQLVTVDDHKIRVVVSSDPGTGERYRPPEIIFTARSPAGRQALLNEMDKVLQRSIDEKHLPAFRVLDRWGDWTRLDELPARGPASVILPPGQMERLTADVGRWLDAESTYARRSIPWHRGHLYEGPPGTGKTSVARVLASMYGMDVWYLPLADVEKDGALLRLVTHVSPRSMLLLEDADVFHAATKRDDDAKVTLSGLLNAMDGIASPHGVLTILTSNSPAALDDAVIRPGRIDLAEHFAISGPAEVARLIAMYYDAPVSDVPEITVAAAEVIEACKRHDTPAAAIAELRSHNAIALVS